VRKSVSEFRTHTSHGELDDDCFAPWYLQQKYKLSDSASFEQSSTAFARTTRKNFDFGIDGFQLDGQPEPTVLAIIQAKFSPSVNYIAKGYTDFEKCTFFLKQALLGQEVDVPIENSVLINLKARLLRLLPEVRARLQLSFIVIHLSELDNDILTERTKGSYSRLSDSIHKDLQNHACEVMLVGPKDMGPPREVIAPPLRYSLKLKSTEPVPAGNGARMFLGIAKLADFVRMYQARRDDLFSKNVRYYIQSTRNTERGPSGRMKSTLGQICIDKTLPPAAFVAYHNGISLYSPRVEQSESDHEELSLTEPYVLNGCQTIKGAYYWLGQKEDRVDKVLWEEVRVPVRIIETDDLNLVREVTVSNNFQNEIKYWALYANNDEQILLQRRFEERGIFYQRQDWAFENLQRTRPDVVEEKFPNSHDTYIGMVSLAQVIMAAEGEVAYARSASDIFEVKKAYDKCFNSKRTKSITLLTFLENVHQVMSPILKNECELEQEKDGPTPTRLLYYSICLLMRHLAKENMTDLVEQYGQDLCWWNRDFRARVASILKRGSGIRPELARMMKLINKSPVLNEAFEEAQRKLRLGSYVNVFEKFNTL